MGVWGLSGFGVLGLWRAGAGRRAVAGPEAARVVGMPRRRPGVPGVLWRLRHALRGLRRSPLPWSLMLSLLLAACAPAPTPTTLPAATPTPAPPPLPSPTPVPTPIPGMLYVDAGNRLGPISPLVYGTNHGPWAAVPVDLLPQAESAGITFLRFPGGNWGDQHDLQDYHIDPFIDLSRRMGAEPSISVRLRGSTPEKAAEVVRYVNVEKGYGVRYWSIGNEPSLYPDYSTEQYNVDWRAFAEAMLAVDPGILLIGPDTHQYTGDPRVDPKDPSGRDWLREFLRANGDLVDIVAVHRYPFPSGRAGPPATVDDLRANSREWDTIIPNLRATIRETTGRDLPIAVTEVNSHWSNATGGEATPDSCYNAIWWADVLGRLIRQGVDIVAHFTLQTKTQTGGWGLLGRFEIRPTYYVYQIYQRFGRELVYSSSDDLEVSVYAALREDGALTIIVVNLGSQARSKPLRLDNFAVRGPAQVWRLDADHLAEKVGEEALASGEAITLPAQSVSLYVLPQP